MQARKFTSLLPQQEISLPKSNSFTECINQKVPVDECPTTTKKNKKKCLCITPTKMVKIHMCV